MDQSGHLYKAPADQIPEEDKLRLEAFVEKSLDEQLEEWRATIARRQEERLSKLERESR